MKAKDLIFVIALLILSVIGIIVTLVLTDVTNCKEVLLLTALFVMSAICCIGAIIEEWLLGK
jgi:hypothetical protein